MESFITTEAGKEHFRKVCEAAECAPGSLDGLDIYVIDERLEERDFAVPLFGSNSNSIGSVLLSVLERMRDGNSDRGSLAFLSGSFHNLTDTPGASGWLVQGESETDDAILLPPPPTSQSPIVDPNSFHTPYPSPQKNGQLNNQSRHPHHSPGGLHITTGAVLSPPQAPSASPQSASTSPGGTTRLARLATLKRLDTTGDTLRPQPISQRSRSPTPLRIDKGFDSAAKGQTTAKLSTQALCYVQSHSPRGPVFDFGHSNGPPTAVGPPAESDYPSTPATESAGGGSENVVFEVSTIIPDVLYLGPEPSKEADVATLEKLGVKRVLNMALEVDDDRPELALRSRFERVTKLPMRDFVEEKNVQRRIDEACAFLDDAGLHSKPAYVHCRAGKSRSVTVVLAYLIHR